MSVQPRSTGVGATLTGGIQDISAILPLIGTEQCERHVGSALTGGYLYAAAAPLSIFGSLGVVKAGITILISSIYSQRPIWLGAQFLSNAGFDLPGSVAPLLGMDGQRSKAETRIVEILEEKKFDDPENLSVQWKSRQWNTMLVAFTLVAALMSVMPYIALLLGPPSWRPATPSPWVFPVLRTGGSCLVAVCSQLIIQCRVISLLKNRILFMAVSKRLSHGVSKDNKDSLDRWLKDALEWDSKLHVEQSLANLDGYLSSGRSLTGSRWGHRDTEEHISLPMELPSPVPLFNEHFTFNYEALRQMRQQHFPFPIGDHLLSFVLGIILLLSLPATVAGYVGCFTLVNSTPSRGNGPLIWLVLEGSLTMLRIVVWASNPKFDEQTAIEVWMKFPQDARQPLVTTQDQTHFIYDAEIDSSKSWSLLPEHEFIDYITPYTGPLDQIQKPDNVALYFTLTSDHGRELSSELRQGTEKSEGTSKEKAECLSLLLTVVNYNMQSGVTLLLSAESFYYFNVNVNPDTTSGRLEASLQSSGRTFHRWPTEDSILFDYLKKYYLDIVNAFGRRESTAIFSWSWNLSSKTSPLSHTGIVQGLPPINDCNSLYLNRAYEHDLKTRLIETWGRWITIGTEGLNNSGRQAMRFKTDFSYLESEWKVVELQYLLGWEQARRELVLMNLSLQLEDILRAKMRTFTSIVDNGRKDSRLIAWIDSELEIGRRKSMEINRIQATKRMDKAKNHGLKEISGWEIELTSEEQTEFEQFWQILVRFIDEQWSAAIDDNGGHATGICLHPESDLASVVQFNRRHEDPNRSLFVDEMKKRLVYWRLQYGAERHEMEATIENIRIVDSVTKQELHEAYGYPEPDPNASFKFVDLQGSISKGKACTAIVYDAKKCDKASVCDVIEKSTTQSVVGVDPDIIASIPPNDHLLFLGLKGGKEAEIPFIQKNRDRWWQQQNNNTAITYFSPKGVAIDVCYGKGTIAHIFLFITTLTHVRVSLGHFTVPELDPVFIEQDGKELARISSFRNGFSSQEIIFREFEPGRYDLEVVGPGDVIVENGSLEPYLLMNIHVEFFDHLSYDSREVENDSALHDVEEGTDSSHSDYLEEQSRPSSESGSRPKVTLGLIPSRSFVFPEFRSSIS